MNEQPMRVAGGQPYGQRKAQEDAQRAMPLPQMAETSPTPVPLSAPTLNPNEPVTAGVPIGPGPGPREVGLLSATPDGQDVNEVLRAIARQFPTPELLDLVNMLDDSRSFF